MPDGYVTRFPVVGFRVVQRSRHTGPRPVAVADSEDAEDAEDAEEESSAADVVYVSFEGDHGVAGASQTMEDSCFEAIMPDVNKRLVSVRKQVTFVCDGDLRLVAKARELDCVRDIGLDLRHFSSTVKKRLLKAYGENRKPPSEEHVALIDNVQKHLLWCYYIGKQNKLSSSQFDDAVVGCVDHWRGDHNQCPPSSICVKSGLGSSYQVPANLSLASLSENSAALLKQRIRAALQLEEYQQVLVDANTSINESFHHSMVIHGSSNGNNGNDVINATLRWSMEVLVWNIGVLWTAEVLLDMVFGSRQVLSEADRTYLARIDNQVETDRKTQMKKACEELEARQKHSDERVERMKPYNMAFATQLIPYGAYVAKMRALPKYNALTRQ